MILSFMNKSNCKKELEKIRSIFSINEKRITQLEHRENFLQSKIKGVIN